MSRKTVFVLDTGAGNILSLINALSKLNYDVKFISNVNDFEIAEKLIFPGVGAFGPAMEKLNKTGFKEALVNYINSDKPFMGICVGMQALCATSEESPGVNGLGIIPAKCQLFSSENKCVPHMGWNTASTTTKNDNQFLSKDAKYYFVHSYAVKYSPQDSSQQALNEFVYSLTTYKDETFVSSIRKGNMFATQFHPEKSGWAGLNVLKEFLSCKNLFNVATSGEPPFTIPTSNFTNRVIACLDVRENDQGDLVVTKGDQYDVREKDGDKGIRNMGKPVQLAQDYFNGGADEVTFLNITSFRSLPLNDLPMLQVLKSTSKEVFVPLTIGGGIRQITQPDGKVITALELAQEYFKSGADKVSIGSDAVYTTESFLKNEKVGDGTSSIEQISRVYGAQAVVISVDPRRVYVSSSQDTTHYTIKTDYPGPNGELYCWYECTVKGGREARDIDVIQLVASCEALGAGEILLNCMDKDGSNSGYDLELVEMVKKNVSIPIIASSGAGKVEHFVQGLASGADAVLAAGIFHRGEVSIKQAKDYLASQGFDVRSDKSAKIL